MISLINAVFGQEFLRFFFGGQIGYWQALGFIIIICLPELLKELFFDSF